MGDANERSIVLNVPFRDEKCVGKPSLSKTTFRELTVSSSSKPLEQFLFGPQHMLWQLKSPNNSRGGGNWSRSWVWPVVAQDEFCRYKEHIVRGNVGCYGFFFLLFKLLNYLTI